MREWITDGAIDPTFLHTIRDGVINTGRDLSLSHGGHSEPIACAVTENASLIGGVTGRTEFQRLFVNFLWVSPRWRGNGLAAEALHRIEAAAVERGCVDSVIETLDDDVAQWYQRTGYSMIAQLPGYCGPWTRHTLLKTLAGLDERKR